MGKVIVALYIDMYGSRCDEQLCVYTYNSFKSEMW